MDVVSFQVKAPLVFNYFYYFVANTARFLKCVSPLWTIGGKRLKLAKFHTGIFLSISVLFEGYAA